LPIDRGPWRYQAMIGTGGIGAGAFFALDGNHTLGREESRSGRFLDRRDYCKLHIIAHYVKALIGPAFAVFPIGKVGADQWGDQLLLEMSEIGLDLRYVEKAAGQQTMYAFCYIYPDGSGGNLTTNDSACAYVDPAYVAQAAPQFSRYAGRGIALAAPEVPLDARLALLRLGEEHGFLRVASFTTAEMPLAVANGMLRSVDLLAANLDEAAAAIGQPAEGGEPEDLVRRVIDALAINGLQLSITAGSRGSWSWDGQRLVHLPAFPAPLASTAGAGDAHLAGIIVGLVAGLSLETAHELAALTAALSITSPHTINKEVSPGTLRSYAGRTGVSLSQSVLELLQS
jgi:ribokinase